MSQRRHRQDISYDEYFHHPQTVAMSGMKSEDLNNPTNNDNQSENTNEAIGEHLESVDFRIHESDSLIGDVDMDAIYSLEFESDDDSFEEISEEEN